MRTLRLRGYVGCAVTLAAIFFIPADMGIFFMTFVLGDENLLGVFSWAIDLVITLLLAQLNAEGERQRLKADSAAIGA